MHVSAQDIGRVPVTVRAELRQVRSPLARILAWAPGTIVSLDSRALARVDLIVHDSIIANGRLGSVEADADARVRALEIERIALTPAA